MKHSSLSLAIFKALGLLEEQPVQPIPIIFIPALNSRELKIFYIYLPQSMTL